MAQSILRSMGLLCQPNTSVLGYLILSHHRATAQPPPSNTSAQALTPRTSYDPPSYLYSIASRHPSRRCSGVVTQCPPPTSADSLFQPNDTMEPNYKGDQLLSELAGHGGHSSSCSGADPGDPLEQTILPDHILKPLLNLTLSRHRQNHSSTRLMLAWPRRPDSGPN